MPTLAPIAIKRCDKCGGEFEEDFFSRNSLSGYTYITRRSICVGCEQTRRDSEKMQDRAGPKASSCLRHHAAKYHLTPKEFARRYDWKIPQMKHDIHHAHSNSCFYCHQPFATMGGGLGDVTLDIFDPKEPPFYATNVRWVCKTCNKEKHRMSPSQWARRLIQWQRWHEHQERLKSNAYAGLPLLELLG